MKKGAGWIALGIFTLTGFLSGIASGQNVKLTVMNPRGIKPPILRIPMATRQKTLDGKMRSQGFHIRIRFYSQNG